MVAFNQSARPSAAFTSDVDYMRGFLHALSGGSFSAHKDAAAGPFQLKSA